MTADALLAIIAGRDTTGLIEVRCLHKDRFPRQQWFRIGDPAIHEYMARQAKTWDVFVGAAPRTERGEGGKDTIKHAWACWADIDHPEGLELLDRFTPKPSYVVQSGSGGVHAWWALSHPISREWSERANKRLMFALSLPCPECTPATKRNCERCNFSGRIGADSRCTEFARVMRPPGTLNHKHEPPVMVTGQATEGTPTTVAALVKKLPDPPTKPHVATRQPRPDIDADDPLLRIASPDYYTRLTGREAPYHYVTCPIHRNGEERTPSLRLNDGGWYYCFACAEGGGIYQFAARLWGYKLPVRGAAFVELRERLTKDLAVSA